MKTDLTPAEAWQPLPSGEWNVDTARHLLRRAAWTARPVDVERAVQEGLPRTLERLFPTNPATFEKPGLIARLEEDARELAGRVARAAPGDEKRMLQREARERSQQALQDLSIKWLQHASQPEHAALDKWTLFLHDVYVISQEKVQNTALVFQHDAIIRAHALKTAAELTKAVSRSPAMLVYLDLQQSQRKAPNENFARELFELFTLGEGNYTEQDVKEAARAFTGYRQQLGDFRLQPKQHDNEPKTIFGQTGRFGGDDVVDLIYQQSAAGTFLPREMGRYFLNEEALSPAMLAPLGQWWKTTGYDLRQLVSRFFSSRLFYEPSSRGSYIKSPVQFYLALVQDLNLNVAPFPRTTLNGLRQMGQQLFQPPNVRGWVGGRLWINSATLGARRQIVRNLFTPVDEANLNADEQVELVAARAEGADTFTVTDERLQEFARLTPDAITARFLDYFLPVKVDDAFRAHVQHFIVGDGAANNRLERVRNAAVTLLQSPEYQLC